MRSEKKIGMTKIDVILLTGFLGSGKTTLLQELMKVYQKEKIGVIVNEFGEISIDGALIDVEGLRMKELLNGSIFCSCLKEDFVNGLIAMSCEDITTLFIEASGLSDPASFPEILHSISRQTGDAYDYKGSICVIDAETFPGYLDLLPTVYRQVAYSSTIIVNKMDLVDLDQLSYVIEQLTAINKDAIIEVTKYCKVDYKRMIESMAVPVIRSEESTNTFETRPKSFLITSNKQVLFESLKEFLNVLSTDSYRIKGFANTTNGQVYISGTKHRLEIKPWEGSQGNTEIVVISSIGIRMMSKIAQGLSGDLKGILQVK